MFIIIILFGTIKIHFGVMKTVFIHKMTYLGAKQLQIQINRTHSSQNHICLHLDEVSLIKKGLLVVRSFHIRFHYILFDVKLN